MGRRLGQLSGLGAHPGPSEWRAQPGEAGKRALIVVPLALALGGTLSASSIALSLSVASAMPMVAPTRSTPESSRGEIVILASAADALDLMARVRQRHLADLPGLRTIRS